MDTVREEEGEGEGEEEEEEEAEDPEDQSPGEWGPNGIFTTVSVYTHNLLYVVLKVNPQLTHLITGEIKNILCRMKRRRCVRGSTSQRTSTWTSLEYQIPEKGVMQDPEVKGHWKEKQRLTSG